MGEVKTNKNSKEEKSSLYQDFADSPDQMLGYIITLFTEMETKKVVLDGILRVPFGIS